MNFCPSEENTAENHGQNPRQNTSMLRPNNFLPLDIQSYLLRFGILGIFWSILGVQSYQTSAGGNGCLGTDPKCFKTRFAKDAPTPFRSQMGGSTTNQISFSTKDFYECQEGSSEHDDLFHAAQEQAWLKCTKVGPCSQPCCRAGRYR